MASDPFDPTRCRHCGRPENRHGKYMGGCMKDGKAMRTTYEAMGVTKKTPTLTTKKKR